MVVTAIVLGLGDRGTVYSNYALQYPDQLRIIAGADPDQLRRESFGLKHGIGHDKIYSSWEELLNQGKIADIVIITTPDVIHFDPATTAMELGYDVLLEKPMAVSKEQCQQLVQTAKKTNRLVKICHVLRYTDFYSKVKATLDEGIIGEVVNITMMENVSYYHYAHSYIRGNWHNRQKSSPMILAKCSHDLDLLYWFAGQLPNKMTSFGGLHYFTPPQDSLPKRCTDGCPIEKSCLYYAPRIYEEIVPILHVASKSSDILTKQIARLALKFPYMKRFPPVSRINSYHGWPVSVITPDPSMESKREALENGPYGRCVYAVEDHDVVDHQIVSLQFQNNITATLTLHGHSSEEGRFIRVEGTKGTIVGEFLTSHEKLEIIDSLTNKREVIHQQTAGNGHGGGDEKLMAEFLRAVVNRSQGKEHSVETDIETSVVSHLMAFAVDEARRKNIIIDFQEYTTRVD